MGKIVVYIKPPTKPLAAKVAWREFCKKGEEPPKKMWFDMKIGKWIAQFKDGRELKIAGNAI